MPQSPTWPAGKSAAISLTYDDGHDSLVEMAMPDLEAAGLRGTMYLNTGSQFVLKHAAAWKAGQLRGHEMGNHSVTHPWRWTPKIDTNGNPEPKPDSKSVLNFMTEADIFREVNDAADWLDANVGLDPDRTYAYPNGAKTTGEPPEQGPYSRAILSRCRIARGATGPVVDRLGATDLLSTVGFVVNEPTADQLIDYAKKALDENGWGIVVFHCVETGWLKVSQKVHREFLAWLANEPRLWVAPMRDVGKWVARQQQATR